MAGRRDQDQAKDVGSREDISNVAAISAADPTIGNVLAEALDKVGKDGVVTVEESNTFGMELEFVEGMQFDKGYISPYFVTDQERMEAVLEDPYIAIVNKKIGAVQELLPLLEKVLRPVDRSWRSPRTSRARPSPRWSSTRSAARSTWSPSRRQASAIDARRCSRTSRPSPVARSSAKRSG